MMNDSTNNFLNYLDTICKSARFAKDFLRLLEKHNYLPPEHIEACGRIMRMNWNIIGNANPQLIIECDDNGILYCKDFTSGIAACWKQEKGFSIEKLLTVIKKIELGVDNGEIMW